jgi:hypothetical protein
MNGPRLSDVWIRRAQRWRLAVPGLSAAGLLVAGLLSWAFPASAEEPSEYQLKAAFLYNFALFTEWPAGTDKSLTLCVYGNDAFGEELDALQGKPVGDRILAVRRTPLGGAVASCQIVFITSSAIDNLPRVLDGLRGRATLTVADSPGAALSGVAINMTVARNKVAFEANLAAARAAGINLSSKLLRLATQVIQ